MTRDMNITIIPIESSPLEKTVQLTGVLRRTPRVVTPAISLETAV